MTLKHSQSAAQPHTTVGGQSHPDGVGRLTRQLYFTSWQYIAQGGFAYGNADGKFFGPDSESDEGARFLPSVPHGVRLVAQQGEKQQLPEGAQLPTLLDDGIYKSWYIIPGPPVEGLPGGHNNYLCYAESEDGMNWRRPKLGLFEHEGSRENNIVFCGDQQGSRRGLHGQGVFLDNAADPAERYKMVYMGVFTQEEVEAYRKKYPEEIDPMACRPDGSAWGLCGAVSPDGLHWSPLPDPLLLVHCDTYNCAYYDERLQQYVAYYRIWQVDWSMPAARVMCGSIGRRAIGRSFSTDFRHFSRPQILIAPGADMSPGHVWYGPGKTTLPGCPDQHLLFPYRWKLENDGMDIHLFSSPDGLVYSEVPGSPVISQGTPGQWDGGYVVTGGNLFEHNGDWVLPFLGYPIPHKYPRLDPARRELYPGVQNGLGYARWPKGRIVALECAEDGACWTIPLRPAGTRMRINASVACTGYVKIGLQGNGDLPGRTVADCDIIYGCDGNDIPVRWHGEDTINVPEEPIAVFFEMRQAKLFGVEFY